MPPLLATIALVAPTVTPGAGAAPTVTGSIHLVTVQRLVDNLLAVQQVRDSFKDGETLIVRFTDITSPTLHRFEFFGTLRDGGARMETIGRYRDNAATHIITINEAAAISLANAFDPSNTGMLILTGGHASLTSQDLATQAGFNAILKTPAKSGLSVYMPTVGRNITYAGCSGTLAASQTEGYLVVPLCGADYVVNALGGVNGRIPNKKLDDYICRVTRSEFCDSVLVTVAALKAVKDACKAGIGPKPGPRAEGMAWMKRYNDCLRSSNEVAS